MNLKTSLAVFLQLLMLAVSADKMVDCGKGAVVTDGGQVYSSVDDCNMRCYCSRGGKIGPA